MTSTGLEKRLSLADRAYERLRHDIVRCALPPGAEFTETELAERLEMSKTPVREALARLQFEGVVRAYPRRGYRIEPIRVSDINEIFDARIVLEAGAVGLAVQQISAAELDELDRLAAASTDRDYMVDFDHSQRINNAFHESIALASRNARLHRMVGQTITEFDRFFFLEAQSDAPYPPGHVSHADIVAIMRRGDVAAARGAMSTHINSMRGILIESLVRGAIGGVEVGA